MKLGKTLVVKNRKQWRSWLEKNHSKENEIWLVYPRKATGKPGIPYHEAVEEALCFGWIDSNLRGLDHTAYAQRFTPRKSTRHWSEPNIQRMRHLIQLGKMTPAGLAVLKDPRILSERRQIELAPDVRRALERNKTVWHNFQKLPRTYRRIRLAFIEGGRRHGASEFRKRLNHFIKKTKENKMYAFSKLPDIVRRRGTKK